MGFPVIWNGRYYSDAERCSHCGRPRLKRDRRWNPKTKKREQATTLCRECLRRHTNGRNGNSRGPFLSNENCPACRDTGIAAGRCFPNHSD
jgi:ribosomal protein L37E